jgi:hypothetical protein
MLRQPNHASQRIGDQCAEKARAASPVAHKHKTLQTEVFAQAIEALRRAPPVTRTATAAQHHHTSRKNDSAASWSAASNAGRALAPMPSQSKANTSLSALHSHCEAYAVRESAANSRTHASTWHARGAAARAQAHASVRADFETCSANRHLQTADAASRCTVEWGEEDG